MDRRLFVARQRMAGVGGFWLPSSGGVSAALFADFSTEGAGNHYYADGAPRANAAAWYGALGGSHTRADASTCATEINSSGLVALVAADVLRFQHDVSGNPLGILLEGARTNLALRSQEIDNASWSKANVTIGANAVVAPDGTTTADGVIPAAATGQANIAHSVTVTATAATFSYYVKNGTLGNNWLELQVISTGAWRGWFNPATGAKGSSFGSPTSYNITAAGNGWYRIDLTATMGTTSATIAVVAVSGDGVHASVTGDGSSPAFYIWGAQAEQASSVRSHIPTAGSTVTRAADALEFDIPAGIDELTFTFDDGSTQAVAVSEGNYAVPTNLDRPIIKSIVAFPA